MVEEELTILDELNQFGINKSYVADFLELMLYNQAGAKRVPSEVGIPKKQYDKMIGYFKKKNVLGKNNEVIEDNLMLFRSKLKLENLVIKDDEVIDTRSTGGMNPCRDETSPYSSTGGMNPCRD